VSLGGKSTLFWGFQGFRGRGKGQAGSLTMLQEAPCTDLVVPSRLRIAKFESDDCFSTGLRRVGTRRNRVRFSLEGARGCCRCFGSCRWAWPPSNLSIPQVGCMAVWLYGSMALWLHGCTAASTLFLCSTPKDNWGKGGVERGKAHDALTNEEVVQCGLWGGTTHTKVASTRGARHAVTIAANEVARTCPNRNSWNRMKAATRGPRYGAQVSHRKCLAGCNWRPPRHSAFNRNWDMSLLSRPAGSVETRTIPKLADWSMHLEAVKRWVGVGEQAI